MPKIGGLSPHENDKEEVRMFGLTRWNQPRGISRLRQDMEDIFDHFFDQEGWMPGRTMRSLRSFQRDLDELPGDFYGLDWALPETSDQAGDFWPRIETSLTDGEHLVRAELPGVTPENVEVNVTRNTQTIRGERKTGSEEKGDLSHRRFSHTLTLPEPVDPEKVKATLRDGVLEIRMPASPQLTGKKIPIQVGAGDEKKHLKAA
jgi:HSP20 family protein